MKRKSTDHELNHDGEMSLTEMSLRSRTGAWYEAQPDEYTDVLPLDGTDSANTTSPRIVNKWLPLDELERTGAATPDEVARVTKRVNHTGTQSDAAWLAKSRLTEHDKARFNVHAGDNAPSAAMQRMHIVSGVAIALATFAMVMTSLLAYSIQGGAFIDLDARDGLLLGCVFVVTVPLIHTGITAGAATTRTRILPWVGSVFVAASIAVALYAVTSLLGDNEATEYVPVDSAADAATAEANTE